MLGIAVGCIGLSYDDFCKLTFGEFESISKAWGEMTENQYHTSWEQTRTVAAIAIQPHIKKKITPRQLLPMPWDNQKGYVSESNKKSRITNEERIERFTRLVERKC